MANPISSLIQRWPAMKPHEKLYMCGAIFIVFPLMAMMYGPKSLLLLDLSFGPLLLCFVAGYATWWVPKFLRVWRSDVGRIPFTLVNAALLPPSAALGRAMASEAIGLPAQSLDLTVGLLAILSYPILWGLLFSIFIGLHALVGITVAIVRNLLWSMSKPFALLPFSGATYKREERDVNQSSGHSFGAYATFALLCFAVYGYTKAVSFDRFIRVIAYGMDFGYASKYPLVDHGRRMRLLDNQYAAYAEFKDGDVKFVVEKLEDKPCTAAR